MPNDATLKARGIGFKKLSGLSAEIYDKVIDFFREFEELKNASVNLSGLILKINMILPGTLSAKPVTPKEVAEATVSVLLRCVPKETGGIVFLSGGQSESEATENLRVIMSEAKRASTPWPITFSFARALQDSALKIWSGKKENIQDAQSVFLERARLNSLALQKE